MLARSLAFPIVRKNDEKAYGEYRTKRLILELYDEMTEAARTGRPRESVDSRRRHSRPAIMCLCDAVLPPSLAERPDACAATSVAPRSTLEEQQRTNDPNELGSPRELAAATQG